MNIDRKRMGLILNGKITQIRIPGDHEDAPAVHSVGRAITLRHKPKGKKIASVIPTEVRDQRLEDATLSDAKREGAGNLEALIEHWRQAVKHWTLSPELVMFRVVTFEVDREEKPRYPANQHGKVHPQQYTTSTVDAIDDAAVDDATQDRITKDAHRRAADRWFDRRQLLRETIEELKGDAIMQENAGRQIRALEHQVEAIDKRLGRAA